METPTIYNTRTLGVLSLSLDILWLIRTAERTGKYSPSTVQNTQRITSTLFPSTSVLLSERHQAREHTGTGSHVWYSTGTVVYSICNVGSEEMRGPVVCSVVMLWFRIYHGPAGYSDNVFVMVDDGWLR